jgi:hypothetical protein
VSPRLGASVGQQVERRHIGLEAAVLPWVGREMVVKIVNRDTDGLEDPMAEIASAAWPVTWRVAPTARQDRQKDVNGAERHLARPSSLMATVVTPERPP